MIDHEFFMRLIDITGAILLASAAVYYLVHLRKALRMEAQLDRIESKLNFLILKMDRNTKLKDLEGKTSPK